MRAFTKDRSFYKSLVTLAIPISLQNLITFAVNFADNVMIGRLGENAISGVYVGNQVQTVLQIFIAGIEGAILVLAAQYWGKRDAESIRKVVSIGVKSAFGIGLAVTAVSVLFPSQIIALFTSEQGVIEDGAAYLQIVGFTYLLFSIAQVMIAAMRSVETAKIGLYISLTTLVVNIGLNYLLIFGVTVPGVVAIPAMGCAARQLPRLFPGSSKCSSASCMCSVWIGSCDSASRIFCRSTASCSRILCVTGCPSWAGRSCGP